MSVSLDGGTTVPANPWIVIQSLVFLALGVIIAAFPDTSSKAWAFMFRAFFFWAPPLGRYYARLMTPRFMYLFSAAFILIAIPNLIYGWIHD